MAVDLSVFDRQKSIVDQQALQDAFNMKKQLANAQLATAAASLQKEQYLDVDKLGKQSIFKAALGQPLSPEETAAARYFDAKSAGVTFDPVTGNAMQKPTFQSQLGLNLGGGQQPTQFNTAPVKEPAQKPAFNAPQTQEMPIDAGEYGGETINIPSEFDTTSDIQFGADNVVPTKAPTYVNPFDAEYQKAYEAAAGNPKAQQSIQVDYFKKKYDMNESQAKSAGFADRLVMNEPIRGKTNITKALADPIDRGLSALPGSNYLVSDDFQSGDQAQRDFINAVLRRESGAVISPEEFNNARIQYIPQPGDSEATLAQKAKNRETQLLGIERSAGAAYKRRELPNTPKANSFKSEAEVNAANLPSGTEITINGRRAVVE